MATEPWYCTREDVAYALDIAVTARSFAQVDRATASGARAVEGLTHRRFYPQVATRYFDWPTDARPWRLWLDADELVSVTSITSGGVTIAPADYFLEPANSGPPYNRVEIDLAGPAAFGGGDTHQRTIAIAGVWAGCRDDSRPAGALAAAIISTTATSIDVTDGALVGVGSILKADSERMLVTERTWLDSGQNTTGPLAADDSARTVGVADGTAYHIGERLLLDSERVEVLDIAGNNLTVLRAVDGSVLAAHLTNIDVYASRRLTVERGALGTTAATHLNAAPLTAHVPPAPVRDLNVAEAISTYEQERSGYARTVGSGDNEREASGKGLRALRDDVYTRYGRKARMRAV